MMMEMVIVIISKMIMVVMMMTMTLMSTPIKALIHEGIIKTYYKTTFVMLKETFQNEL